MISRLLVSQRIRPTLINSITLSSASRSAFTFEFDDNFLVRREDYPSHIRSLKEIDLYNQKEEKKLRSSLEQSYAIVSPVNLIRFALLGDLAASKKSRYVPDHIYAMHNVEAFDTNKEKIKKLTYRFRANQSVEDMHACEILSKIAHLSEQNSYLYPSQLSHILSLISSTKKGCSVLALPKVDNILIRAVHNTEVNTRNRNFIPNGYYQQSTSNNVFMTINLNNLALNMISRGITPGPRLVGRCLKTAANRMQFESIQMYLDIFNKNEFPIFSSLRHALTALTQNILQYQNPQNFVGMLESERTEIKRISLQIITGWENNGVPVLLENRKKSFGILTQPKSYQEDISCTAFFTTYIFVLADLGLIQSLEHEWISLPNISRTSYNSSLFATAFLVAKKPHIALSILDTYFKYNYLKPMLKSELLSNSRMFKTWDSSPHISHIFLILYAHYRLKTTVNLRNKLERITIPKSPRETLEMLVEFIPPRPAVKLAAFNNQASHYLSNKSPDNAFNREEMFVEWTRDIYGEVGLLVSTEGGKKPLYWRPVSLSRRQLFNALDTQET